MKPPIIGPTTGPFKGPIAQILNANALYSSTTISLILPGALDTKLAAAKAPKNLGINSDSIFLANAQGRIKRTKMAVEKM